MHSIGEGCSQIPVNISFAAHSSGLLGFLVPSNSFLQKIPINPEEVSSSLEHPGPRHEKRVSTVAMLGYLRDGHNTSDTSNAACN